MGNLWGLGKVRFAAHGVQSAFADAPCPGIAATFCGQGPVFGA
jgi:hypothetical protein